MSQPSTTPEHYNHPLPPPFTFTQPAPTLITQGAESLLYRTHHLTPNTPAALKIRPTKPWRHPTLDARLTKQRVLAEARVLVKLAAVGERRVDGGEEVVVPGVYAVEWDVGRKVKGLEQQMKGERGRGAWILMEWIEGWSVKDVLRDCDRLVKGGRVNEREEKVMEENVRGLLRRIGRAVGVLHAKGGVVHGDLTTSNVMVRPVVRATAINGDSSLQDSNGNAGEGESGASRIFSQPYEIVLIDFGLATQSIQDEDRAVDLYVLERAFGSTHPRQEGLFDQEVLQSQEGYRGAWSGSKVVLKRLEDVRLRGRKRSMVG